jgi:transposase-like protein
MARQGRKTALGITLSLEEQNALHTLLRQRRIPAQFHTRVRGILLFAAGESIAGTARQVGVSRRHLYKWIRRFLVERLPGLYDHPRPPQRGATTHHD